MSLYFCFRLSSAVDLCESLRDIRKDASQAVVRRVVGHPPYAPQVRYVDQRILIKFKYNRTCIKVHFHLCCGMGGQYGQV